MKLNDLKDGQTVRYRIGRAETDDVNWQEWTSGVLYLVRRAKAFRHYRAGEIVTLTVRDIGWAEYGEKDFFDGTFTAEDYYLQIDGLMA